MIKAILFDRDGIIINSEKINVLSAVNAFNNLGIRISKDDKKFIVGKHTLDYIKYFQKKYSFPKEIFLKKQRENYYELFTNVEIFSEVVNLIKKLKTKKYKLALTTSSHLDSTKDIINKTGLDETFDVIVTFDDCKQRKPHPFPYLLTAKKLNVKPEECLVVEDSFIGLESAKNADMKCVVIPNKYTKEHDFEKADFVVEKAREIEELEILK